MKVISIKEYKIKDSFFDIEQTVIQKGLILEPNENNNYLINLDDKAKEFSLEEILDIKDNHGDNIFKKYDPNFNLNIKEIQDEDHLIKEWRIQLDVKTSKKNIKEIYKAIELYVLPKIEGE
jgi:hypothetical protein